jgi:hypothetical protein
VTNVLTLKRKQTKGDFLETLNAAVAAERRARDANALDQFLSPEAWVAEAIKMPFANEPEMKIALEAINQRDPMILQTYLRLRRGITTWFKRGPSAAIRSFFDEECDQAISRRGVSRQSFFAAVGSIVAKEEPQRFGTATSINARDEAIAKATEDRDRLIEELRHAWSEADLTLDDRGAFFSCSGGSVRLTRDFPAALVACMISSREAA